MGCVFYVTPISRTAGDFFTGRKNKKGRRKAKFAGRAAPKAGRTEKKGRRETSKAWRTTKKQGREASNTRRMTFPARREGKTTGRKRQQIKRKGYSLRRKTNLKSPYINCFLNTSAKSYPTLSSSFLLEKLKKEN